MIKLDTDCLGCGDINTGFKYTCVECTKLLPKGFYKDEIYRQHVPYYIPRKQWDQYIAKYIIKHLEKIHEISNDL